jgi:hypothetical protein
MCAANWVRKEPSAAEKPKYSPQFIVAPHPGREMRPRHHKSTDLTANTAHDGSCAATCGISHVTPSRTGSDQARFSSKSSNERGEAAGNRSQAPLPQLWPMGTAATPLARHANALPDRGRTDGFAAAAAVHHVVWCSNFNANQLLLGHGRRPWSRYDAKRNPRSHGLVTSADGLRKRLVSVPQPAYGTFHWFRAIARKFRTITRSRLLGQDVVPVWHRR